jgi:phage shock protein A
VRGRKENGQHSKILDLPKVQDLLNSALQREKLVREARIAVETPKAAVAEMDILVKQLRTNIEDGENKLRRLETQIDEVMSRNTRREVICQ